MITSKDTFKAMAENAKEGEKITLEDGFYKSDFMPPKEYLDTPQVLNEWQLCPKCNGNGDTYANIETNQLIVCDLCNGKKIISKVNGLPPQ